MVDNAVGKYERVFAQNFEDVLRALNIGYILRKAAAISNPQMEVIKEHAMWTIKTSTIFAQSVKGFGAYFTGGFTQVSFGIVFVPFLK